MNRIFRRAVLSTAASLLVFPILMNASCTSKSRKASDNSLHIPIVAKVKGLDPVHTSDTYSAKVVSYVYEGLLQYHYLKRPYELIPNLAEKMPEVSKDGKTYTFTLKKGVLFQDDPCFKKSNGKGREVIAEDFIYSFKRLADPKLISPGWWIFDKKIVGLNEWRDAAIKSKKADYAANIEGLKVIDRYTFQIKLKKTSFQFLYYFAMPFTFVVPQEAVEHYGKDFLRNPVGTGPYKFARGESNLGSKLVFDKNKTFRDQFYPSEGDKGDKEAGLLEDAGKKLPLTDRIVVHVFVESQPQWLNFLAGKLDISGIPKDNFSQAITPDKNLTEDLVKKGIKLVKATSLDVTHTTFNMEDKILGKNKYLRQAMSIAYDMGPAIDLFYNGRAVAAQGPIPPGLPEYDPNLKNPYRKFNLAKAKELMKKAGYPDGKGLPQLRYSALASTTSRQFAEYFKKSMAEIGVKIKIEQSTWPEFQKQLTRKSGQLWGYAWLADYPDAENFLQLFYGPNQSPGPNDANYQNPAYDKLYEQLLKLPQGAKRMKIAKKMIDMVIEDCAWAFGVHRIIFGLRHPWLKNYKLNELDQAAAKHYRVDHQLRSK